MCDKDTYIYVYTTLGTLMCKMMEADRKQQKKQEWIVVEVAKINEGSILFHMLTRTAAFTTDFLALNPLLKDVVPRKNTTGSLALNPHRTIFEPCGRKLRNARVKGVTLKVRGISVLFLLS